MEVPPESWISYLIPSQCWQPSLLVFLVFSPGKLQCRVGGRVGRRIRWVLLIYAWAMRYTLYSDRMLWCFLLMLVCNVASCRYACLPPSPGGLGRHIMGHFTNRLWLFKDVESQWRRWSTFTIQLILANLAWNIRFPRIECPERTGCRSLFTSVLMLGQGSFDVIHGSDSMLWLTSVEIE